MAIRKLPNGKYRVEITKNYTFITSKTFTSQTLAQQFANQINLQIETILSLSPKKIKKLTPSKVDDLGGIELFHKLGIEITFKTFKDLHDQYINQWTGKDQVNQIIRARYWRSLFSDKPIKGIKPKHIKVAVDGLKTGLFDSYGNEQANPKELSNNTVLRYKSVLSAMFKFAIEQMYLKENPVDLVKVKATPNKIVRYLSNDERIALLKACQAATWDKLYLLVLMGMTTGMRKSEMLNLKWSDIDFDKSLAILSDSKNGEARLNAIPNTTMVELKKFRKIGNGLIFSGLRNNVETGKPFEFKKQWQGALRRAEITNFRFHDLRHTSASYLIMNGASLKEVAEVLGHKSTQTTDRYAHLSTEHKSKLVERVMGGIVNV